jgi:hypothetical protein
MTHVFQSLAAFSSHARSAIRSIGSFVRQNAAAATSRPEADAFPVA